MVPIRETRAQGNSSEVVWLRAIERSMANTVVAPAELSKLALNRATCESQSGSTGIDTSAGFADDWHHSTKLSPVASTHFWNKVGNASLHIEVHTYIYKCVYTKSSHGTKMDNCL